MILHEYLPTIKQYITTDQCHLKVILGAQVFFNESFFTNTTAPPGALIIFIFARHGHKTTCDSLDEIMAFVLDFLFDKQCTSKVALLQWYNSEDVFGYIGFRQAQELAQPFIKLLQGGGKNTAYDESMFRARQTYSLLLVFLVTPSTRQTIFSQCENNHFVLQKRRSVAAAPELVKFFSVVPVKDHNLLNYFYQVQCYIRSTR